MVNSINATWFMTAKRSQCHRCCFWNRWKGSIYCTNRNKSQVEYILYISSPAGKNNAQCCIHGFCHKYSIDGFCQSTPLVKEICWIKREETVFRCSPLFRVGTSPMLPRYSYCRIVLTITPGTLIISMHFAWKCWPVALSLCTGSRC